MAAKRGAFILFEGVDRCGKTTQVLFDGEWSDLVQARNLVSWLKEKGHKVKYFRFPDRSTPIGKMIDSYLCEQKEMCDQAIHLLFSANRWERSAEMKKALLEGSHLVVDRYAYSGVVYSASKGLNPEWCFHAERGLLAPDVVLFLNMSIEETSKRGGYGSERYENTAMQKKARQLFSELRTQRWKEVDASKSEDEVFAEVCRLVSETMKSVDSSTDLTVL